MLLFFINFACKSSKDNPEQGTCGLSELNLMKLEDFYTDITKNVNSSPTDQVLPEDTNGTLQIDLNPNVFPILSSESGVFAAASSLGNGRIVAFSGQDFIGSQERSTLLGNTSIDTLIDCEPNFLQASSIIFGLIMGSSP